MVWFTQRTDASAILLLRTLLQTYGGTEETQQIFTQELLSAPRGTPLVFAHAFSATCRRSLVSQQLGFAYNSPRDL